MGTTENCRLQEVPAVSDCQFQRGRVFGVDLTEHLQQSSCLIPHILEFCCDIIDQSGVTDGVYRLSGQSSHIVTLRREFEGGKVPHGEYKNDVHAVASLLKVSCVWSPWSCVRMQMMMISGVCPEQLLKLFSSVNYRYLHT